MLTVKRKDTQPRKLPTQQRSKDKVERILVAAAEVLAESGYDQLKVVTIAKKAGAAVGSVYQFFPNKHAIMTTLVERWLAVDNQSLDTVESRVGQYNTVVDEFIDLAELLVANYKEQKGLLALVSLCRNIPELHDMEERHDKQFARRLAKIITRHGVKGSTQERLALAGYYSIIVDATAISIASDTSVRGGIKLGFLRNSIVDLFSGYQ